MMQVGFQLVQALADILHGGGVGNAQVVGSAEGGTRHQDDVQLFENIHGQLVVVLEFLQADVMGKIGEKVKGAVGQGIGDMADFVDTRAK